MRTSIRALPCLWCHKVLQLFVRESIVEGKRAEVLVLRCGTMIFSALHTYGMCTDLNRNAQAQAPARSQWRLLSSRKGRSARTGAPGTEDFAVAR